MSWGTDSILLAIVTAAAFLIAGALALGFNIIAGLVALSALVAVRAITVHTTRKDSQ